MAAPLFAWDGQTFITYFYTNAIGVNAFLWTIKGSFWAVVKCYAWSYGPGQMLGWFGPFLLAGALAGLGAIPRNARATPLFLLGSSVCSLAVMLIGRHNNPFFGLSYQLLLWFAFLQIFLFAQPSRFWKPLLLLLFFCAFLGNYTRPPEGEIFRRGDSRTGLHYNEDLVDAIARDGGLKDHKHPAQVFLTVTGDVNIYAMRWQLCKRRRPLCFSAMARSTDPAAFIEAFRDADYVIVPCPGPGAFTPGYPRSRRKSKSGGISARRTGSPASGFRRVWPNTWSSATKRRPPPRVKIAILANWEATAQFARMFSRGRHPQSGLGGATKNHTTAPAASPGRRIV